MPPIASLTSTPATWPARAINRSCPLPQRYQYSGKSGNKLNRTSRQAGRSGHDATQRQRHPTRVSGNTGKKIGNTGNDSGNEIGNRGKGNATAKTAETPAPPGLPGTILATATALVATPAKKSATPLAKSGKLWRHPHGDRWPPALQEHTPNTGHSIGHHSGHCSGHSSSHVCGHLYCRRRVLPQTRGPSRPREKGRGRDQPHLRPPFRPHLRPPFRPQKMATAAMLPSASRALPICPGSPLQMKYNAASSVWKLA